VGNGAGVDVIKLLAERFCLAVGGYTHFGLTE
jgi:hypothetical protein